MEWYKHPLDRYRRPPKNRWVCPGCPYHSIYNVYLVGVAHPRGVKP